MATRPTIPQTAPSDVTNLVNGCGVYLRPIEIDLLGRLYERPARNFTARELAEMLCTTPDAIRTFVFNLRRALGAGIILSVPTRGGRARGYRYGEDHAQRRARQEADEAIERLLTLIEGGGPAGEVRAAARAFWDAFERASTRTEAA